MASAFYSLIAATLNRRSFALIHNRQHMVTSQKKEVESLKSKGVTNQQPTTNNQQLLTYLSYFLVFLLLTISNAGWGQTAVPMSSQAGLTYTENFADIANWTDNFASGTGASRWGSVALNATGTIPDGVRTSVSTATFQTTGTSGGVQRGSLSGNPAGTIVLLATGATSNSTASAIDFLLNFTGVNAGTISFDWTRVNNGTGDRGGSLRVYTSTNGTTFTELTSAAVNNIINNGGTASGSITTVSLPSSFNGVSTARIRFYYFNGTTTGTTGSRPKISIDNLTVTATASSSTTNFYSKSTGNLDVLSNWTTDPAGGAGSAPSDFITANQVFNVRNNASPTITASTTWTVSGTNSKIVVGDGTNACNLTIPSTSAISGTVDVSAGATLTVQNNAPPTMGTLNSTSTVVYSGTSVATGTYGNLTISTSGTATAAGAISASGTLTISSGATLDMGSANVLSGAFTPAGTGTLKTSVPTATSATPVPASKTWTMTVQYASASSMTVLAGTYASLDISGGNRTLPSGTVNISGTYTPGSGTLTVTGNTINFSSSSSQTIPAANYNSITNTGNGARTLASTGTIGIAGSFTPGTGSYTVTGSTIQLNGAGGTTITLPSVASGNNLNILNVGGSAGTYTLAPRTGTSYNIGTLSLLTGNASILLLNGTNSAYTIGLGDVTVTAGTLDGGSTDATTGNYCTVWNVSGDFTVNGGIVTNSATNDWYQINFTKNGSQVFNLSSGSLTYPEVVVASSSVLTLNSNLPLNGISGATMLTVNGELNAGTNLVTGNFTTTANTYVINGTLKTANINGLIGASNRTLATSSGAGTLAPLLTLGVNSTIEYNASSTQTVTARTDYANLTLSSGSKTISSGTVTVAKNLTINSGATYNGGSNNPVLNVGGNWSNAGTFTSGSGTTTFNGTTGQTFTHGGSGSFHNLTLSNSAGLTLNNDITIAALTLSSGNITTGSNKVIISTGGSVSRTSGHVVGNLQKNVATGAISRIFEIGTGSNYTPVSVQFGNVTVAGDLTATTAAGSAPATTSGISSSRYVNRIWTLTNSGVTYNNYSATLTFVAGDILNSASTSNFIGALNNSGTWSNPTVGTLNSTSSQLTGITAFGSFYLGESRTVSSLSGLTISSGTLTPTFASGTTSYTATVPSNIGSVNITPTSPSGTTLTVNGIAATSGSASAVSLSSGLNSIPVVVTAEDGTTTTTYTLDITRTSLSSDANLSALAISSGTLTPTFAAATTSYAATVTNATTSINVTPTVNDANATVTVAGSAATSGSASSVNLSVGVNNINVVVTAEDGTTTKTYTIAVTRPSNDANLSALTISSVTLSPSFTAGTTSYTGSVTNATSSVTVTPTRNENNATIQVRVNGGSYASVTSGSASGSLALNVGSNTIDVLVTAQDGTTNTYTITVTRAASSVSTLSALTISSGTLSPTFASATTTYTASVGNATSSVTVTPIVTQANATIQVRVNSGAYSSVTSGSASGSLSLNEGSNTINLLVTAQDGTSTSTYTITVTRADATTANVVWALTSNASPTTITSNNISAGNQQNGSGITFNSYGANGANSSGWNSASKNANDYYEFTVSPLTDYVLTITSISTTNNISSGTGTAVLEYSYNSFTSSTTVGSSFSLSSSASTTNFTGLNIVVNSGQTLSLRLYAYGLALTSTTFRCKDFTINGTSIQLLTPPTLTAASSPTVDAAFDVTFTDNASTQAWVSAGGTSVTVGGTALTAGYTISNGKITFDPSASVPTGLLQSAGASKSIVISKTGYNNATVSQTIGAGLPSSLSVTTSPTAPSISGGTLGTQPAVTVSDQYGNAVSGVTVTAAVRTGQTTSWSLGGTTTATTNASGVATFTNLTATNLGSSAFTTANITFTPSTGTGSVNSSNFTVPAPASKLAITAVTPSSPTAGGTFSVTVQSQDASNNATNVLSSTGIQLSTNGNAGIIGGTTTGTISASGNSVTISGVTLASAGTGVTLTATQTSGTPSLTAGTSSIFSVLAPATYLTFENVPATGSAATNLSSFTVSARRSTDNSIDLSYSGSITISKASGPGTLSGTLTVSAVNGVATFSAAQFDQAGTYTLSAASGSLTGATSSSISLSLANTTTVLWASAGGSAWLTGSNWTGGAQPTSSQVAQFGVNPTPGTAVNINGGTTSIAGIDISSSRILNLSIGNNSGTASNGTLTLNGAVIGGTGNIIIRNNSANTLTIQNTGSTGSASNTMALALTNGTDNVIAVESTGNVVINSIITGTNRPLTKAGSGSGVLTLSGANTYSGGTNITSGTLRLGAADVIPSTGKVTLNGGTLSTGASTGFSETAGALDVDANSTIAFGTGNHTLTFANSKDESWAGTTLTITGWGGTAGSTNTNGPKIFFGSDNTGLTAAQRAKISFSGYTGTPVLLSTGELVPPAVPQGSLTSNGPICSGQNGQLTWTATSGTGNYTVVYNDGTADRTASSVTSGTAFNVFANPVTNTTYTLVSVTDANGAVRSSGFTAGSVSINVNSAPSAPTAVNNSRCGTGTVALSVIGAGGTYKWYSDAGLTTQVGTESSSFTTPSISSSTSYYVTETSSGCASAATTVTATVNSVPTAPTPGNNFTCGTGNVALTVSGSSGNYKWYSDAGLATQVGTGSSFTATSISSTTNYYVTSSNANCTSSAATVTATFNNTQSISLTSAVGTNTQSPTFNTAITPIQYTIGGAAEGVSVSGLPTGVTGSLSGSIYTISGSPQQTGPFSFTVTTTPSNSCSASASGTITVGAAPANTANYRTNGNGSFNDASIWQFFNGSSWVAASSAPAYPTGTNNITVRDNLVMNVDYTVGSGKSFNMDDGTNLTINPGITFSIAGTANFNNQSVILKSTSAGTATIGQITGTLNNATNVTVERYMTARRKWRALTAPLTGSSNNSIYFNWQNNGSITTPNTGAIIWNPDVTSEGASGMYDGGFSSSMLSLNTSNNTWTRVANTIDNGTLFTSSENKAYMLFYTGPYNKSGNFISSGSDVSTLRATGQLRTGSIPLALTQVGWHMIGNPYASPVLYGNLNKSNLSGTGYIWNPGGAGTGAFTPITAGTIIQSGQAFFVYANSTTASLTFDESDKFGTASNSLFRTEEYSIEGDLKIELNKYVAGNTELNDVAIVNYKSRAEAGLPKLAQFYENMSIYQDNTDYGMTTRKLNNGEDQIQLRLWQMKEANYQIKIDLSSMKLPAGSTAVLQDVFLNKETSLSTTEANKVDFNVTSNAASTGQRFRIVLRRANVPVTSVETPSYQIYPNPVQKGSSMQLEFRNQSAGKYEVVIYSMTGVRVQKAVVGHNGGTAIQQVSLDQCLSAGSYLVEVIGEDGLKKQLKLILQ